MENNFLLTDEMLWDYADGFLNSEEKKRVDAYLAQHPEQRARLALILSEKKTFSELELEKPNPQFANAVMAQWAAETKRNTVAAAQPEKDWIVRAITAFFGIFILAAIGLLVVSGQGGGAVQDLPGNAAYFDWLRNANFSETFNRPMVLYSVYLFIIYIGLRLTERVLLQRVFVNTTRLHS